MFGFGKKQTKTPKLPRCQAAIHINHVEGLSGVPYLEGVGAEVRTGETNLELEYRKGSEKEKVILPLSQIVQINIITWENTILKALNPMAEALVTGMIAGDAMAVAAAVDAKGRTRQEKVKLENALEIIYHPRGDMRTTKRLVFWDKSDFPAKKDTIRFAEKICHLANLPGPNFVEPKPKGPTYL